MKIRTRLAIQFTIIVASLLLLFASSIYYFSSTHREKDFEERLFEKANNYAQLLIKLNKSDPSLIKLIDRNTAYLPNENILVYNSKNELLFSTIDNSDTINATLLNKIRTEKKIKFNQKQNESLGLVYEKTNQPLTVIVSAFDKDGFNKLQNLKLILIIGLLFCIFITTIAGWIYARQALNPISSVISQVDKIGTSNLEDRVEIGNGKDEIAQMAITFNQMLNRIQNSFELQKSFVANASHEFRTPLTSIKGQLEVSLMSDKKNEEYKEILQSILEDINNLSRLTNGLLDIAQADMNNSRIKKSKVRIDELLWLTRNIILRQNPEYKINIQIDNFPEDETKLIILGNEQLLRSAISNIIDNACKFSKNKEVDIVFAINNSSIEISFIDKGIGISAEDLKKLSQPFYRGTNAKNFKGHGLGLSLTFKIISLYNGKIEIESILKEYTSVKLIFNNNNQ